MREIEYIHEGLQRTEELLLSERFREALIYLRRTWKWVNELETVLEKGDEDDIQSK